MSTDTQYALPDSAKELREMILGTITDEWEVGSDILERIHVHPCNRHREQAFKTVRIEVRNIQNPVIGPDGAVFGYTRPYRQYRRAQVNQQKGTP